MFAYCNNCPVSKSDPSGYDAATDDLNGNGIPDYLENRWVALTEAEIARQNGNEYIDPNKLPNPKSGYVPPKGNPNPRKVRNPNGRGYGWPAQDGGVWVPDNSMDGGPGWVVQYPNGRHEHHYPDGHVRKHNSSTSSIPSTSRAWYTTAWYGVVSFGAVLLIGVCIADDLVGFAPDDVYIEELWNYATMLWE